MPLTYPANFIGPIGPTDKRASKDFIGPTLPSWGYSKSDEGEVLGASDSNYGNAPGQQEGENYNDYKRRIEEEQANADREMMMQQIEDEYSNIMGAISGQEQFLNAQESGLNSQLGLTEQQITQGYGEVKPQIEYEQGQRLADLAGQQTTAEGQTKSVLGQARRTYNELLSGANKFSGSAGEAYGELLGRSTAETMGDARQSLANTVTQIQGEVGRVKNFYQTKLTDLAKNMNLAIQQARQDFRAEVDKINQARYSLGQSKVQAEQAKSNQSLQALQNFQMNVAQIRQAAQVAQQSLQTWTQNKEAELLSARQEAIAKYGLSPTNLQKIGLGVSPEGSGTYNNYLMGGNIPMSKLQGSFYSTKKTGTTGTTGVTDEEEFFPTKKKSEY